MLLIKMCVMISCAVIIYQDLKDRSVIWTLFPMLGILLAYLHIQYLGWELFLAYALVNCLLISMIILLMFVYTKAILKKPFLNHSFGLGDLLFFYAFALGFPSVTFLILFAGSVLFASLVFYLYRIKKAADTVPLAGLMGIFLLCAITISLIPNSPSLYLF